MANVIIIIWKWDRDDDYTKIFLSEGENNFTIELDQGNKLIGFTNEGSNKNYSIDVITDTYNAELVKHNKVLLLLHSNENDKGLKVVDDIKTAIDTNSKEGLTIRNFGNSEDNRIYGVIITKSGYNFTDYFRKKPDETFNECWNNYDISKKVTDLKNMKTDFIKLWLPIAIDMTGLNEVKDDRKSKEYLDEINKSYDTKEMRKWIDKNMNQFPEWKKVKKNIFEQLNELQIIHYSEFPKIFENTVNDFDNMIENEQKK